jgi:hypothetical protein
MNCNKTIARSDDYLRCSKDCAGVFHLACVRVSKALFAVMKTEDKVRSWVCVGCSSDVTSPIPNIEKSVDNMFNLTSTVLSDTAGNTIKTDVLLPPFLPDSNTLNNVPDAFKNVFSEFSGTIYKYFEIFGASMRNHFNSLNGQLADLRKENSLLRTEIQKLTDKLSQKELLQNKSQDLPLSNVLSYADTIKRCASVVVMPKESSQAVSKTKSDIINKIDPSKSNVDISGVRSTKNGGLILKCHDPSEFKKFALDNKLVDSYEIKDLKTISPRLRISGVSSDLGKEHIISFLVKQNSSVFSNPSQLKILKYFPTKKKPDVFQFILQVDVNTYIKALNSKHCLIGLDNCYIFDAIDVIRCYRCNGYHHSHTFCKRNLSCPRCGESHEVKECKSTVLRCINCVSLNSKTNLTSVNAAHACWDTNECQYYLNLIANIKKDLFGDATLPS